MDCEPVRYFPHKVTKCRGMHLNHLVLASTLHQQLIMHIRQLFAILFRRGRKQDTVKQNSYFLDLPVDLIYAFFDELQLPEKVLLSETCRDLWYILRHQCASATREATAIERLECLAVLGDILPDHRCCASCSTLHRLDPKDLPVMSNDKFYMPCPAPEPVRSRHRLMSQYSIAFRHVQLAIKYTRLRDTHQDYRASVMQRFTTSIPQFYSMRLIFSANPTIICGRFILMSTFIFYTPAEQISLSDITRAHFQICPHLGASGPLLPYNRLLSAIGSACKVAAGQPGLHKSVYSCYQCPTDFTVAIHPRSVSLLVWQDLGAGVSPADPCWHSHIWTDENNRVMGTKFNYEHGSIKKMYYSGRL